MYRTDNSSSVAVLPTPAAPGPKPNAFFTDNPAGRRTVMDADWCNAVQEEICYVIQQGGITLSKTDRTQLFDAIGLNFAHNLVPYGVASGTNSYTVTLSPAITSLPVGLLVFVKFTNANTTTSVTINANALGVKSIFKNDLTAPLVGEISANMVATLIYNGTQFILLNISQAKIPTFSGAQTDSYNYVGSTGGTSTAYTATLTPAIATYTAGLRINLRISNATNTGPSTLNVNGLGVKTIQLNDGSHIKAGDLANGNIVHLVYDGTNFKLLNPASSTKYYALDTGAANAYVASIGSVPLSAGLEVHLKIVNANTGDSTLNVGAGATSIRLVNGSKLFSGCLVAGQFAQFVYDGTNFQLLNPSIVTNYLVDTGTANTYAVPLGIAPPTGMQLRVKILTANTGASTLNTGSGGALSIALPDGSALLTGHLLAGQIANLVYNGTVWQLLNPQALPAFQYFADTGTANNYEVVLGVAPTTGDRLLVKILNTNSGASTLLTQSYYTDTGTALDYVANVGIPDFVGQTVNILLAHTNSGACTLRTYLPGTQRAVKTTGGASPGAGTMVVGTIRQFICDGVNWVIQPTAISRIPIKLVDGSALTGGELVATHIAALIYDGTNWQLINPILAAQQTLVKMATGASENLVNGASTVIPFDTTIPQISEGTEIGTIVYTPKSATNILNITATFHLLLAVSGTMPLVVALFRDAVANALNADSIHTKLLNDHKELTLIHSMVAGQTTPITFRYRAGGTVAVAWQTLGGTSWSFGLAAPGRIVIKEFTP